MHLEVAWVYTGNLMVFAACSGAFFSYLTLWPVVMDNFGYDATAIGLSFIPQTLMFIIGGYTGKRLIQHFGVNKALLSLVSLFMIAAVSIVAITLVFTLNTIYPLLAIFALMAAANGAIYPIVVNQALQTFKQNAAKAAGLQNFIQISFAFGMSSIVAKLASLGEKGIGIGILISALFVVAGFLIKDMSNWQWVERTFTAPDPARIAIKQDKD